MHMIFRTLFILIALIFIVSCAAITESVLESRPDSHGYYVRKSIDNKHAEKINKSIIVFVHGVIGDSKGTWVNSNNNAYWPDIVKQDCELDNFDIYVSSYYSPTFGTAPTIPQLANGLGSELSEIINKYEYIVIVAHSMGNLVSLQAAQYGAFKDVENVLLLSMGSPSNGGEPLSKIVSMISNNPQFKDMHRIDNNSYLQTLRKSWEANPLENIEIACAYEIMPISTKIAIPFHMAEGKVVDEGSALAICTRPDNYGIVANHIDMVKPRNTEDYIHTKWLKKQISEGLHLVPKITLMDSHIQDFTYRAGSMNHYDIRDYLLNNKLHDATYFIETIDPDWMAYRTVTEKPSSLIIIHFSGFFDGIKTQPDREIAFKEGSEKLKIFIDKILSETTKTKIVIYSRWHESFHGIKLGEMENYVKNEMLNSLSDERKERVFTFDVNKYGKSDLDFKNPKIVVNLEKLLIDILTEDKGLKDCIKN